MSEIITGSEVEGHKFIKFFSPGWVGTILYALLGIIILLILNLGSIIHRLSGSYIGSPEKLKANFSTLFSGFNNSFNLALGGRLGLYILWAVVGAAVYMGIWFGRNLLDSFENDVISAHYLHPSGYKSAHTLGTSISIKMFLAAGGIITTAYCYIAATAALPAVAALAASAVYNFNLHTSPFYIVLSILCAALILYIGATFFKLLAHLWKLL